MRKLKTVVPMSLKHGMNISSLLCFWCLKPLDTVMMGKIDEEDSKAPETIILGYEPCQSCIQEFKKGVLFISCTIGENEFNNIPIAKDYYPTGAWSVVADEDVNKYFSPEMAEEMIKVRNVFLPIPEYNALFGHQN